MLSCTYWALVTGTDGNVRIVLERVTLFVCDSFAVEAFLQMEFLNSNDGKDVVL